MVKTHTTVTIDGEVLERAQKQGFNISGEFEKAIIKRLGLQEVNIPILDGEKCDFCGRVGEKATRENLNGLTWLCPDERWICNSCLDFEKRKVVVSR